MQLFLSLYDYKSAPPDQAADRAGAARARLLTDLPGVQMVLTGRIRSGLASFGRERQLGGAASAHVPAQGELIVFKSDIDADAAFASSAGEKLAANSQAELENLQAYAAHGAAFVPFDSRAPGARCFVALAGFVLDPEFGGVDKAERHYAAVHTRICARLPGCEGYIGGIVEHGADHEAAPYRLALSFYRDEDGLRAALKSPVALAIEQDARGYSKIAMLYFFDATVAL